MLQQFEGLLLEMNWFSIIEDVLLKNMPVSGSDGMKLDQREMSA